MMPAIDFLLAQATVAYFFCPLEAATSTVRSIALVVVLSSRVVRGGSRTGRGYDSQGGWVLMSRAEHEDSIRTHVRKEERKRKNA